jgi:hypothetical protein
MKSHRNSLLGWGAALGLMLNLGMALAQTGTYTQYLQMGNNAYISKDYTQAATDYQAALQENPSGWAAYQGLGSCYYAQGNMPEALRNYEEALRYNPNNPPLAHLVQGLKAKVGNNGTTPSAASNTVGGSSSGSDPFELDVEAGLAVGNSVGFGGGVGGFAPMDPNFSLGGLVGVYTFNSGASESENFGGGNVTAGASANSTCVELMFAGKYRFDSPNIRPFLLGGVGAAYVSTSSSTGGSSSSGSMGVSENLNTNSSTIDPMLSVGGGVEFPMGNRMDFFAQARLDLIISVGGSSTSVSGSSSMGGNISGNMSTSGGGTTTYVPIEVGLRFDL